MGLSDFEIEAICDQELFLSDHYDKVFVQTINGKISLLSLEEFDEKPLVSPYVFFTRADYNLLKNRLSPEYHRWAKSCTCGRPSNPFMKYIGCDNCEEWFHPKCQGVSEMIKTFLCPKCK